MRASQPSEQPLLLLAAASASAAGWLLACAPAESSGAGPTDVNVASVDASTRPRENASNDALDGGALVRPPRNTYAPEPADGGESCTLPPINPGAAVPLRRVGSDPPSPTGGTIAAGTYHLKSVDVFTGSGGSTGDTGDWLARRCTFTPTAYGCLEREGDTSLDGGPTSSTPFGGVVHSASGSTIAFGRSCPPAAAWIRDFTATATELHLFTEIPGATVRETMLKE